jgi:hypothetical protein
MDVYFAGSHSLDRDVPDDVRIPNLLKSFYEIRSHADEKIARMLSTTDNFMLDSGAFTLFTNPDIDEDLDAFIEEYIAFVREWDIDHYVELDIDSREGLAAVREYRDRIERGVGRPSIPVWHQNRGKDCFLRLCEEYDYIALGGIVNEISSKWYKYFPWFIRQAHARGTRIHGMGFTPTENLQQYPFDSVDSRTWMFGSQSPASPEYTFTGTDLEYVEHDDKRRDGHYLEIRHANCRAWVQYAHYLRGKYGLENYEGPRLDRGDEPPPPHIDRQAVYHLPPESEW